jgi:cyclophilin family peptidyl-prolyl cis-trans isomerase
MFHGVAPVLPLPNVVRPTGDTPDVIDLSQSFNTTANPTRVAFDFDAGRVIVELFESAAPLTVANFLNYVRNDRFDDTIIHRSAILGAPTFSPFVIQGGGFRASDLVHIQTFPPVLNEFRANTQQRGTISMAKQGNNPNSATSEWFFNLRDNRDILDNQNGGFTSFGQVVGNGMAIVDRIAALPVIVQAAPSPFNELGDFPIQNFPPTPQDYVNVSTIAELPELSSVTSDNTGLVNPVLQGTQLTLNYVAGATGVANVTINALDRTGTPLTQTFAVQVGGASVAVGQGTTANTITYTDADGTVGVVSVKGGSANVQFTGTGLTQTPAGRNVAVAGTNAEIFNISVTSGTPAITVKGTGGADQRLVVSNGITGGAVRSFNGREVILRGTSTIAQGIGRLDLAQAQDAAITIGTSPDGKLQPTINLSTGANDTDITSLAPIRNIRFGAWTSDDSEPDVITAPFVGTLQSAGDFSGGLTVNGAPLARTLNNVRVGGAISGAWNITGAAGSITANSTAATWTANFNNIINSVRVTQDWSGNITASAIRTARAGSVSLARMTLLQPAGPGAVSLGSLNAKGAMTNSTITSAGGDILSVTVGSMTGSYIATGVAFTGGVPSDVGQFLTASTIWSVNVRNRTAPSFLNSVIAATNLGRMNLGVVNTVNNGTVFGLGAQFIASVNAVDQAGAPIRFARLDTTAESQQRGDFVARVLRAS